MNPHDKDLDPFGNPLRKPVINPLGNPNFKPDLDPFGNPLTNPSNPFPFPFPNQNQPVFPGMAPFACVKCKMNFVTKLGDTCNECTNKNFNFQPTTYLCLMCHQNVVDESGKMCKTCNKMQF